MCCYMVAVREVRKEGKVEKVRKLKRLGRFETGKLTRGRPDPRYCWASCLSRRVPAYNSRLRVLQALFGDDGDDDDEGESFKRISTVNIDHLLCMSLPGLQSPASSPAILRKPAPTQP